MKKNNLLKTVLLFVFTILFLWSCRQESLYTDTKNNNNQRVHNKISLNTFKQETKVSKIEEFTVLKNSKPNGKDAGATSTFIIDSTSIYKLGLNNNLTTYSFRAYNIFESPDVLYNLVYHIKDGKTGYRIFKIENNSAIPVYDSEIGAITIQKFSSKRILKTAGCTESIRIYIWDCKNGQDWEHCDHCKDCYDVSYYDVAYDCSGGLSGGSGTSTEIPPYNNTPQCGESNAGYSGVMLDPSGYYFDPNEPLSIDAEKLRASYAYNFWNQLDYSYQLWVYNGNIDTYQFILENYLNHYSTTNNTNNLQFANWGIDFFIQNPNTTKEQFQYIIYNKTSYETNLGDDDNNTIGGYDNTTYNTFNPQQQPWTTIQNVLTKAQFIGWGYPGVKRNCMDYCKAQIGIKGYQISNYSATGQTIQMYTAQNGVNKSKVIDGLSYLKYALSKGIPVIVGVDDAPGNPGNADQTTDHFIVIVGMGTDSKGNYFSFFDNASGDANLGASPNNKLYYDSVTGLIQGTSDTPYASGLIYTLTQIRKSKLK